MREPSVAGVFYKLDALELNEQVHHYLALADKVEARGEVRALIVPHAGYVYSGEVAAIAYKQVETHAYKNVFLIGTSHRKQFAGAAVYNCTAFNMPLGKVVVNTQITNALIKKNVLFKDDPFVHADEHSLEVQLPFLQTVLDKPFSIVPILMGSSDPNECKVVARYLKPWFNSDNLFIISTDFSHYPAAKDALVEDKKTAAAIISNEPQALLDVLKNHETTRVKGFLTGLCGWSAVLTLQYLSSGNANMVYHHLKYQNSGDKMQKDKNRVVGYHAMALICNKGEFTLDESEKETLLQLCHKTLVQHFGVENDFLIGELSEALSQYLGAFVSVYHKGELRGCTGYMSGHLPLYKLVQELVLEAALHDARFEPVKKDELNDVQIEISVLTPLTKVNDFKTIDLQKHGIYVKKGLSSGTFLPQVGARNSWTIEEYLGYCSRDKARIGWDGWRQAEIFTYEAIIFSDKR